MYTMWLHHYGNSNILWVVYRCMDAWYKARNMSSFWGWVGVNNSAFEEFYFVKLGTQIWDRSFEKPEGIIEATNTSKWGPVYHMPKGTFPTHLTVTSCSVGVFLIFTSVTHCHSTQWYTSPPPSSGYTHSFIYLIWKQVCDLTQIFTAKIMPVQVCIESISLPES